jgi:hypothetical protein
MFGRNGIFRGLRIRFYLQGNDRRRKEVSRNGRSKEKDIESETGFAPGAEYEDALAGSFRMPALS